MARVLFGLMILLGGAGLLAGCDDQSVTDVDPGGPPVVKSVPAADDPLVSTAPVAGKIGPVPRLTQSKDGDLSVAWELNGISAGDQQLVLHYLAGDGHCVQQAGFRVVETAATVTLTALVRAPSTTAACEGPRLLGTGYLDLESPLAGRRLIHAEVDPAWSTLG